MSEWKREVEVEGAARGTASEDQSSKVAKLQRSAEQASDGGEAATGIAWSSQDSAALRMEVWDPTLLLAAMGLNGPAENDEGVQLASVYYAEEGGGGGGGSDGGDGGGEGGGSGGTPSSQPASQPSSQPASQPSSQPASQPSANTGDQSWVSTEKKAVEEKDRVVKGKDYPTFEDVALKFFGKKSLWPFVAKENPTLKPNKIGPATKIKVPASVEVPKAAERLQGDPSSGVTKQTWNVEGDAGNPAKTLSPHVPTDSSGVTLGKGYDMKERSATQIETQLKAAGIDAALAKKCGGAAKKVGEGARKWVKDNKPFAAITAEQEKSLFRAEYQRQTDSTVAFLTDPDRGYVRDGDDWKLELNFKDLKPEILAFLVDLKYRGDLNDSSWGYIKAAVVGNNLEKLSNLVAEKDGHKKYFFDNHVRYKARCEIVGATPVSGEEWKQ